MTRLAATTRLRALGTLVPAAALLFAPQVAQSQGAQPVSPEVQIFTLVAQAEHVARKCDAFSHEGQFLYLEFKRRLVNSLNQPLLDSISRTQAPTFAGSCSDLSAKPEARKIVDYFNNEGARMLALHSFLPEQSPCAHANAPAFRQRAAKAWKALSSSQDPRLQPAAMQAEANMIASQCTLTGASDRARAHAASFMAETLAPVYAKPASYRGEMTVSGSNEENPTFVEALRDTGAQVLKGGVLAGMTRSIGVGNEVLILRDGRLAVAEEKDSFALLGMATVEFRAGGKTYPATQARSVDPRFGKIFVLDAKASKAVLAEPSFGIGFKDAEGTVTTWEETYQYQGRKKTDQGTSVRPVGFDTTAFKAALTYASAPEFR
tara:strand:+ start:3826 stop:4956 length:1131 start_codon:yes stop_codon:yes gene_type:complete